MCCFCLQLLRSSIVSNRTQSIVADELGLPGYLVKQQEVMRSGVRRSDKSYNLKMKERADLLEGTPYTRHCGCQMFFNYKIYVCK